MRKTAIIIGASAAGVAVASQLLKYTDIKPIVLEKAYDAERKNKALVGLGVELNLGHIVRQIILGRDNVPVVYGYDYLYKQIEIWKGDYFYSSIPVGHLLRDWKGRVVENAEAYTRTLIPVDVLTLLASRH